MGSEGEAATGPPPLPDVPPGMLTVRRAWERYRLWWETVRALPPADLRAASVRYAWRAHKRELQAALRFLLQRSAAALECSSRGGSDGPAPSDGGGA